MREIEMMELVGNVARKVGRRFGGVAAEAGLSTTEALTLWKIFRRGGCSAGAVAELLGLSPSTVTGLLDRLVAGGWLIRKADPEDRRALLVETTPKLAEYVKSSKRAVSKSLEKAFKDLPPELIGRLCEDLALVLEVLEREEGARR
jgi:DNA-binding MarR family transcriptional regulator